MATKSFPAVQHAGTSFMCQHRLRQLGHTRIYIADLWPPNSPDLNPVKYKIWGRLQERVYQKCCTAGSALVATATATAGTPCKHVLIIFSQTWLCYVWLMAWQIRLSVCRLWRVCTLVRGFNFLGIFLHHIVAWPSGNSPTKNHGSRVWFNIPPNTL